MLQSRHGISRRSTKFTTLQEGFQQFTNDLNKLQQFVEINGTAFSKILKKWDKTSKSKTKELYLSRAVEVQPFFNATVISELSDQATTSLQELGAWAEGDNVTFDARPEHVISSQHLPGTDEGDADTLLLDTVLSGNLESLRDLLSRLRPAAESNGAAVDASPMERMTRTFLSAINGAPDEALQLLLATGLVDIQSEDDINERNCLHQATIYGNSFVLDYALSKGVAVDRTDVYGRLPLHYASMHGRLGMIDTLLSGMDMGVLRRCCFCCCCCVLTEICSRTPDDQPHRSRQLHAPDPLHRSQAPRGRWQAARTVRPSRPCVRYRPRASQSRM